MTASNHVVTGREDPIDPREPLGALSEFYRAFNCRDLALMERNWVTSDDASMASPLGGIRRGWLDIREGYEHIFQGAATVYVLFLFMPTYAIRVLKLNLQASFVAPLISGLMLTIFCPIGGYLSDRWGRKAVMATSAGLFLIAIYPAFIWLNDAPSVGRLALVEMIFGLLMAGYSGPFGAALADMFSVGVRVTGMSIVYNLGVAAF